jgi:hypothetical protein
MRKGYSRILVEGDKNNEIPVFYRATAQKKNPDVFLRDSCSDSRFVSRAISSSVARGLKKNSVPRSFFEGELKSNEKRIWWEEQENYGTAVKASAPPVDRFKSIY